MSEESKKETPSAMDVYEFLWRGRDFELSHLWQRSVFLAVFLLGIVSMYSIYFKDVFLSQFIMGKQDGYSNPIFVFGLIPSILAAIGIIFSKLWIMMAKGSKAWYEIYEDSIAKVSGSTNFWSGISIKDDEDVEILDELKFGKLSRKPNTPRSNCLFSTEGGSFSVSKINVMIGIVFLILFILLFVGHIGWTVSIIVSRNWFSFTILDRVSYVLNFVLLLSVYFICPYIKKKVASSYNDDTKNNG